MYVLTGSAEDEIVSNLAVGVAPRHRAHPIGGAILILLGIATFIFFPALVKKITGREVLSTPYSGFGSGGD